MRLGLERRRRPPLEVRALQVVAPRTNAATIGAARHFFAGLTLAEPLAVELTADQHARAFVCRAGSLMAEQHLRGQLSSAYPQAELRSLPPELDPARVGAGEQALACVLELRAAAYLPIRVFDDLELESAQADPVLGCLGALGDLPPGWRAMSQLVFEPAPEDWCREFVRLAVQHPLAAEQGPRHTETSLAGLSMLVGLLALVLLGYEAYAWFLARQWLPLAGAAVGLGVAGLLGPALLRRLLTRRVYDMALVRQKIEGSAFDAQLRLAVIAPADASQAEMQARLDRLTAAYRPYNVAAGNGFVARRVGLRGPPALRLPRRLEGRRGRTRLTNRELAGLWHLPQATSDIPLLERTAARTFLPLPAEVARGCRIGTAEQQGQQVAVAVPEDVTRRHLLLVAKTRRGKSTLLLRLAAYTIAGGPPARTAANGRASDALAGSASGALEAPASFGGSGPAAAGGAPTPGAETPAAVDPSAPGLRRGLLLVDPHRDLAQAALGVVPAERWADVVALDVGDLERPFGLNLLDIGLGWDRDRAVANALTIFRREWDRFWGPRMEDAFRFALLTLFEANEALCAEQPGGRDAQHTILDVPALLCETPFRRRVVEQVRDPAVRAWWSTYFDQLDHRLQLEVINPVLTKVHRFEGSRAARNVVGQPRSTIDPVAWVRDGAVVIVNTARGTVGEDTAALIGGTLVNLVALAVGHQVALEPARRRPITLLVDEFHTLPGADYEAVLAELSKYGANLVLATQSLARLAALDRETDRGLQASVFANLDGLFAFNCSAEDARYLVPELGGALAEQDLVELSEHQCYVRLSSGGRRLPTFSVKLDPPLVSDPSVRAALVEQSAQRYGRSAALVEADRRSALARVELARTPTPVAETRSAVDTGRNQHRPRKRARAGNSSPPGG